MSELNHVYEKFPQVMVNVHASNEQKSRYRDDEYIAGFIESQQQSLMGQGRVLVRVSGTEPLIRVMVEGRDAQAIALSAERMPKVGRTLSVKENSSPAAQRKTLAAGKTRSKGTYKEDGGTLCAQQMAGRIMN